MDLKKKKINICDFGSGGMELYFQVSSLNINKLILIDAVEVPLIVDLYKKVKKKYLKDTKKTKICFLQNYNEKKKYEIIHISDSLQYIENYKNFIKKIILKKPKFVILNNLTAGDNPEYPAEQKFYDNKFFYKFFNLKSFVNNFKNYEIIYSGNYLNKINGKYTDYPQSNFKKSERLIYPCTLIFKLKR